MRVQVHVTSLFSTEIRPRRWPKSDGGRRGASPSFALFIQPAATLCSLSLTCNTHLIKNGQTVGPTGGVGTDGRRVKRVEGGKNDGWKEGKMGMLRGE